MKLHDPDNRLGKPVRGAESVEDFTLEGARAISGNCPRCNGDGLALIYSPRYTGEAVERTIHPQHGVRQILRRSVAYCLCPAGRKIAVMHQQESKDVFLRTPDIHDVIAEKYPNWQTDDPTYDPTEPIDLAGLPDAFERLYQRLGLPQVYYEPDEPRLYVERDYDEPENLAAS